MSVTCLAAVAGVRQALISEIELESANPPSSPEQDRLALGVRVEDLFGK